MTKYLIPEKKLSDNFSMPVLGLGSWLLGGTSCRDEAFDVKNAIEVMEYALTHGFRAIDTAQMYADGAAEAIIGESIKPFDRGELLITSKVWKDNLSYDGVLRAAEGSLKRLGCDYLDLYLVHQVNENIPMSETFRALDRLVDEKIVRNIGVSNFSLQRYMTAQKLASHKLVTNQIHYNLMCREAVHSGMLQYAQDNDILITAYRPLQKGLLLSQGGALLARIGAKYQKTPAQIALNWLIRQKNVVTITTMRDKKHIDENIQACNFKLTDDDFIQLEQEFPDQQDISNVMPLS